MLELPSRTREERSVTAPSDIAASFTSTPVLAGFHTFGDLPTFPFIGGAPAIEGFDSPACGTCWNVTFNGTTATVAAIDAGGPNNFNIAHAAMDFLTGGRATFLGVVNASAVQVNASACGL